MSDSLEIRMNNLGNPYRDVIAQYLSREFPANCDNEATMLETLTHVLVASSKVRFGPQPTPENLVAIRAVLAKIIATGAPIQLLMPWGSKKPDNGTVDVAELGGLKTLIALQRRVQTFYAPGIALNMRVEDTSGDYLFKEEGPDALSASAMYVQEFLKLVRVLGLSFINAKLESQMLDVPAYVALADELRPLFFRYIAETDAFGIVDDPSLASYKALAGHGWKGFIPSEQRNFYRSRYARSFPGIGLIGETEKLAGYFATILARIKMHGYGAEEWGDDFIHLSFAPPVPGTPRSFSDRRLYYRTLPETMGRTHIPPWRARGYLQVNNNNDVRMKLANFADEPAPEHDVVTLSRNGEEVAVRVDLLVEG